MANTSTWFKGNARLDQCLVSDPAHVQKGDRGDYVTLIQGALMALDTAIISVDEQSQKLYGPSTAQAVLTYKRKRQIINPSYQTQADDIVGRMTMLALDTEMGAFERRQFHPVLAFGITAPTTPKSAIVSESNKTFRGWAKQSADAFKPNMLIFDVPPKSSAEASVGVIKQAIAAASGGLLILSVETYSMGRFGRGKPVTPLCCTGLD
ncbi:peptidoglycan-binding domain-containing protein [Spirosoma jeollabukense]